MEFGSFGGFGKEQLEFGPQHQSKLHPFSTYEKNKKNSKIVAKHAEFQFQ